MPYADVHRRENMIKLLCVDEANSQYTVLIVFSRRRGLDNRALGYFVDANSNQIGDGAYCRDFSEVRPTYILMISDSIKVKKSEIYISGFGDENDAFEANLSCRLGGVTVVHLSNFRLSMEQVKTPTEKWCYFLKHGGTWNMISNDATMIGDDAIFKRAYEELNQDHWSKEEIYMYEQEMQKKTQQDAEEWSDTEERTDQGWVIDNEEGWLSLIKKSGKASSFNGWYNELVYELV